MLCRYTIKYMRNTENVGKGSVNLVIVGVGVDIIEIDRVRKVYERKKTRFLNRVFTSEEIEYIMAKKNPFPSMAARFSAKEAVSKALGTGIGGKVGFKDIIIENLSGGQPAIRKTCRLNNMLSELEAVTASIHLSLSHSRDYAVAYVIISK